MKECNQCGKCCTKYGGDGLSVSASEIEQWEIYRPDLFSYVRDGNIWINPDTNKQLEGCPWLQRVPNQDKTTCAIYFDRPDDCKIYPATIAQMVEDGCEMLEAKDLAKPKQAQNTLNMIMIDSRPSYEPE
ncbi:MAG: zinc/iron-chelating domain-containing protein [Gammaproteobacteria bacterium]|nr:zinc/iron-chelating domain-containing protein [Gammaproteobacteria bacterium]HJN97307.1 YkgJ family cysteine cluster protein [Gammaproteobacteria bacterium]